MNQVYVILIFLFLIISIIYFLKYQKISKKISESVIKNENNILLTENEGLKLENEKYKTEFTELRQVSENLKEEILRLKENFLIEKQQKFDEGIKKGKELSNYRVEIEPYKEVSKSNSYFRRDDKLLIGRKYIMFINDIITPFSHVEIFETISYKEINEERVNSLLTKISDLTTNITPISNIKLIGNIAEFGGKLLSQKK